MSIDIQALLAALGTDAQLHAVGGAVRDLMLGRQSGDLDMATALSPEVVMQRARNSGYRVIPTGLRHGTVTVMMGTHGIEITTFRGDGDYTDGRRPESVRLGVPLAEDLARRDFTINAMALPLERLADVDWRTHLVDPFGGSRDLDSRVIRAVGDPLVRFAEDGLRPLRACRFASQLGFDIHPDTLGAIAARLDVSAKVAAERVMTELTKLLCGRHPSKGLRCLEHSGLLDLWLSELRPMVGCEQNAMHAFDVWEHSLHVVEGAPAEPAQRWAALLHDAGKPATRSRDAQDRVHFFGHEHLSEQMAERILSRLKSAQALKAEVCSLIRHHNTHPGSAWSDAACRRFLRRLDQDHLSLEAWDAFVQADLQGKGIGADQRIPEHVWAMSRMQTIQLTAPHIHIKHLALDGKALQAISARRPGPWLGNLQRYLIETVIEEPGQNTPQTLTLLAKAWLAEHALALAKGVDKPNESGKLIDPRDSRGNAVP